jgi:hypothetical protein
MPEEIPVRSQQFSGYIYSPRLSVAELVAVLKTFEGCSVTAISNGATFSGLDDIKSAPARFSGHPSVTIHKVGTDSETVDIYVSFNSKWIEVTSDLYSYKKSPEQSDALARSVHEELKPFGFAPLRYVRLFGELTIFPIGMLYFTYFVYFAASIVNGTFNENFLSADDGSSLHRIIWTGLFVYWFLFCGSFWVSRRKSVTYSPRATWWQKHGESALTGIVASILTFIVVTFALK